MLMFVSKCLELFLTEIFINVCYVCPLESQVTDNTYCYSSHCRQVSYRRASLGSFSVPKVYSLSEDLTSYSKQQLNATPCQRTGIMAAFNTFDQFKRYLYTNVCVCVCVCVGGCRIHLFSWLKFRTRLFIYSSILTTKFKYVIFIVVVTLMTSWTCSLPT